MPDEEKARNALRRRRRLRQMLGAVVCLLVVIGLGSVVSGGVRLAARLFDDTEERTRFEERLQTLVSLDPDPSASLEEANRARLLDAAIWSVIQQNNDRLDTYERDEIGAMYLPTLDIDRAVASLYGPDFHFTYETFSDNGLTFQYVAEKNAYLLPITSVNGTYAPRVVRMRRENGGRRVTIGYLDVYGTGELILDLSKLEPVKYLDYIFQRVNGEYYLTAIVKSDMSVSSSSSSDTSSSQPIDDVMDHVASALPQDGDLGASDTSGS